MSRDTRLVDVDGANKVANGVLTLRKHLDNAQARRIRQGLEQHRLHHDAYVQPCMRFVKRRWDVVEEFVEAPVKTSGLVRPQKQESPEALTSRLSVSFAPTLGLEPRTRRLTAACSTN